MSRDPNLPSPLAEWSDAFREEPSGSPIAPVGTVYFVYGPPGGANIVACKVEQVPDWSGAKQAEAVIVTCPICQAPGRVSLDAKPFRIDHKRVVMRTQNGPVPVEPLLTVMSPYACGAQCTVTDEDTQRREEAICPFHAIIRKGVAYDIGAMAGPNGVLTRALRLTHEHYERAQKLFVASGRHLHPQLVAAAQGDLNRMFAALQIVVPTVESGRYERDGLQSIVGCMDELENIAGAAARIVLAIQQAHQRAS